MVEHRAQSRLGLGMPSEALSRPCSAATHKLVRLNQQFCLQRPGIPDPGSDEVVQLIARTDQTRTQRQSVAVTSRSGGGPTVSIAPIMT